MPTQVRIETFSYPATELVYPALTVCKKYNYDVAEYLRAIFDNFDASHDLLLQDHFRKLLKFNLSRVNYFLSARKADLATGFHHNHPHICLRRSLTQAYKPLFTTTITSQVKKMTNHFKNLYNTKFISLPNKLYPALECGLRGCFGLLEWQK